MALVKCPECGKSISSEAASCPQCGYSLTPVSKRVPVGWVFRILFGVVVLLSVLVILYPIGNNKMSPEGVKEFRSACDPVKADGLVKQMIDGAFFHKIYERDNFLHIYVKENWYLVPIEEKRTWDIVLQCHFTRGTGDFIDGAYSDYQSDKIVAYTGGGSGFRMK